MRLTWIVLFAHSGNSLRMSKFWLRYDFDIVFPCVNEVLEMLSLVGCVTDQP